MSLRSIVPGFIKRGVRAAITSPPGDSGPSQKEIARELVLNDMQTYLPPSRVKIEERPWESKPEAPFADFFARFNNLFSDSKRESNAETIAQLERDYPVLHSVAIKAREYLLDCDSVKPPMDGALRRVYFQNLSLMNTPKSYELITYKKRLPRVGLMTFPNPEPKEFLSDALQGKCHLDDMEPGKMLTRFWEGRECDFQLYQACFKEEIEKALEQLPPSFLSWIPDRQWFIQELCQHTQYQMALKKLLDEEAWDLIIVGAMEVSIGLTLFDSMKGKRPPVMYMHHAILFGEPLANLFLEADEFCATSKTEVQYLNNLGIDKNKILRLGSMHQEAFPSVAYLDAERARMRAELGIEDDACAIVYGLTMDFYLYKKKPCDELTEIMIEAFQRLVKDEKVKKPYLFLKYHPSPRSDPYFSFSRQQMPLEDFVERLKPLGFEVRLIKDLAPYLKVADCFVAHESATVLTAAENGCATLSLSIHQGKGQPTLGFDTYKTTTCHKLLSDYDSPSDIAKAMKELIDMPREIVYAEGAKLWKDLFECGRTEALTRMARAVEKQLSAKSKA